MQNSKQNNEVKTMKLTNNNYKALIYLINKQSNNNELSKIIANTQ